MNDNKPKPKGAKKDAKEPRPIIHLGMMGDGTEEQNSVSLYRHCGCCAGFSRRR